MKLENETLSNTENEPVAWRVRSPHGWWSYSMKKPLGSSYPALPLYDKPQKREWVNLTDDEIWEIFKANDPFQYAAFSRAIEAKLREKNA